MFWIFFLPLAASAQTAARVTLTAPITDTFPRIETYLDVRDSQGKFIHGLKAGDIRVLENELQVPVLEISELRPGVQIVTALNPGPTFAVRNSQGVSRFDFLVDALRKWATSRQGTTLDDWSLLTTNGIEVSHVSDPMDWISGVMTDTLNAKELTPSLDILFRAVDLAADPTVRPGMGRAVLFISPPVEGDVALSLQNLTAQAQQQGVHVFVWMITPTGAPINEAGDQLNSLASQTGGQFSVFSGEEAIPNPEDYLDSLRNVYRLTYNSQVTRSGSQQIVVEVQTSEGALTTPAQVFELDVQSPNPAFISPALEIRRKPPEESLKSGDDAVVEEFIPAEHNLQVVVDFPDGRVRPLVSTSLYVDGTLVAENTEPPFDQFTWDLSGYATSGQHLLRVEAKDTLGLVGSSIETAVEVVVDHPEQSVWKSLNKNTPILMGLSVVLAGAVLLLVLVMGGRIRPSTLGVPKLKRSKSDPVTQPIPVKNEPASRHLPSWVNRLQWPQRPVTPKANAFLTRIAETEATSIATPIPITADEITLGSDPNQATLVLNDPSVEPLHARLIHNGDGVFRMADEGSVAGTWINYTPVSEEGTQLEHGDLVHIGRMGFRFTMRQPHHIRKPVITLEKPPLEKPQKEKPRKEIRS